MPQTLSSSPLAGPVHATSFTVSGHRSRHPAHVVSNRGTPLTTRKYFFFGMTRFLYTPPPAATCFRHVAFASSPALGNLLLRPNSKMASPASFTNAKPISSPSRTFALPTYTDDHPLCESSTAPALRFTPPNSRGGEFPRRNIRTLAMSDAKKSFTGDRFITSIGMHPTST